MTEATQDAELASQAMARHFELDEAIAIIQGKHKAELEPLLEEQKLCDVFVKDFMNTAGIQQYKIASGSQAYFTTKDSVSVEDFDATIAYILEHQAFHMLNKAVNKTAVKEYIEVNKAPPPGVKYDSYRDLNWRRGKG